MFHYRCLIMKTKNIPQDDGFLSRKSIKELYYTRDENGNYETGLSKGWEAKNIALEVTIEEFERREKKAKNLVLSGKKSPIVFFMEKNKMDWSVLSSYMEKPKWLVKLHQYPFIFKKIKPKTIKKYTEVFEITLEDLTEFNERNKL